MNENTEYEKLVQSIYQSLLKNQEICTVNVLHDVKIKGRSGCKHQIDVYWEIEINGEIYKVAIECKNYTKKISVGIVRDFFGVLYDIGNIKGVIVTKIGYQNGALKFADYHNISLREIRFPTSEDWMGRVKNILINVGLMKARILNCRISPDELWLYKNIKIKSEDKSFSFTPIKAFEDEVFIYDKAGNKITDFLQMKGKLPLTWNVGQALERKFIFDDGYLDTIEFGKVKIKHVEFIYDVINIQEDISIEGEIIAKAIIKNVKKGEMKLIDKNGNVRNG